VLRMDDFGRGTGELQRPESGVANVCGYELGQCMGRVSARGYCAPGDEVTMIAHASILLIYTKREQRSAR
jgi:hypothetical protein